MCWIYSKNHKNIYNFLSFLKTEITQEVEDKDLFIPCIHDLVRHSNFEKWWKMQSSIDLQFFLISSHTSHLIPSHRSNLISSHPLLISSYLTIISSKPGVCFTNDFFYCNSNSMETSPCCHSIAGHQIAANFYTCHDNTAIMPCTNFLAITVLESRWEWKEISIEFELRWKKNVNETEPCPAWV